MKVVTLVTGTAGVAVGVGMVLFGLLSTRLPWSMTTLRDELFQERDRLSVTRRQLIVEGMILLCAGLGLLWVVRSDLRVILGVILR